MTNKRGETLKINKVKILFITTESWFFVSHFLDRAIEAKKAGFEIYVAARDSGGVEKIINNNICFVEFNVTRGFAGFGDFFKSIRDLRFIIKKINPDIIHNIALKIVALSNLATYGLQHGVHINAPVGFGYIFSSSDNKARILRAVFNVFFQPIVRREKSLFIVENSDDLNYIVKNGWVESDKVFLIEGAGVDLDEFKFSNLPIGKRTVVMVARMLRDKGVYEFVDAARHLKSKWPDVGFCLVGDPDLNNPSTVSVEQLNSWNQEGCIEWLGFRENVAGILRDSWLYCLPSYREGLPKSVIEAMAIGRPIVTCDVPGCRSLVENGVNGILVKPKNSTDLAQSINILLEQPLNAEAFGVESRRIAEQRLSKNIINLQTVNIYKNILNGKMS
jgi:glycosyltransferase involved in cell wall biosynthesis